MRAHRLHHVATVFQQNWVDVVTLADIGLRQQVFQLQQQSATSHRPSLGYNGSKTRVHWAYTSPRLRSYKLRSNAQQHIPSVRSQYMWSRSLVTTDPSTWRHRSRDHLIVHMPFPIGGPLDQASISKTVSEIFNVECSAVVDITLTQPLNECQGHSFWYQSISHIRLPIGSQ